MYPLSPFTPVNFDTSYMESGDYLMFPEKYAKQEWIRRYGEPKTQEEIKACDRYVAQQQPNSDTNCSIV